MKTNQRILCVIFFIPEILKVQILENFFGVIIIGDIIGHDDYLKLKDKKKLFCEFYEWIGSSSEGKLQGYIQQWYRNGNKRFEGNYVDGKKHGDFMIFKENGEEEFFGTFENGELLQINYGF